MKNLLIVLALIIAFNLNAQSTSKIPEAAKAAFHKLYSNAEKVKWSKEGNDFEVDFKLQGKNMSALFDTNGQYKEIEEAIDSKDIPVRAMAYFKDHYKNGTIKETAKLQKQISLFCTKLE